MFALGLEEDLNRFTQGLKRSMGVAVIGALFPFMAGYGVASFAGYEHNICMLWGLTMTATAVSLTMMSLRGDLLHKSTAATGIMTAAIIDDVASLIGVAILIPLIVVSSGTGGEGGASFIDIAIIIGKVIVFFAITLFMGLIAFPERAPRELSATASVLQRISYWFSRQVAKVGVRKILLVHQGEFTPLVMLFFAMMAGVTAHLLGFHPAIGAYFAGLFFHREYFIFSKEKTNEQGESYIEEDNHFHDANHVIEHLAFTIFGPIFFINLGGKLIFDVDIMAKVLPIAVMLFLTVLVFQVLSASIAARFTGNYKWHESIMIGLGMLGRAELAFIVINIAFVQEKIIGIEAFYTLMFACFMLNITVPIVLKLWKPYYLGFKQLDIMGIKLSRPEAAVVPEEMAEYKTQMEQERRQYLEND
ncbi:MAG: Kef-type K+ transport system membrane component KefB [Parasphingorhabdus sp.]|jgi:Kef-type K+ transport system membrane component KefB